MHQLTKYFIDSQKTNQTGCLGLEVEHFVINRKTGMTMPYEEISLLMEYLTSYYPKKSYEEDRLIALESKETLVTLEPGCQLECSLECLSDLDAIKETYKSSIAPIKTYLNEHGYDLVYSGGLPTISQNEVMRIDKKRYEYMENYFKISGTRGLEMMKATAAVHVSIDYINEMDFIKKYRMANILHPIFAFLTSNTKMYEGKKNQDILLRDSIWKDTDHTRCGIIPSLFDENFGYHSYVEWLENLDLILMNDDNNFIATDKKLKEVADEYGWSKAYISHYLSMSFLDIRLKQFIEIRSADSMPINYTVAYCALIKGLFYNEDNIEKYSQLTDSIQSILDAKNAIRAHDWDSNIYGLSIYDFCLNLLKDAECGLKKDEIEKMDVLESMIKHKSHVFKEDNYEL